MKDILKIYKMMFKYWDLLVGGLLAMVIFAMFSGVSITFISPLFDYVFTAEKKIVEINEFSVFYDKISDAVVRFISNADGIFHFSDLDKYTPLLDDLNSIMAVTDSMLLIYIICVSIFTLYVLKNFFFFLNRIMFVTLRGKVVRDMRDMLFGRYLSQSLSFFQSNRVGDSLVRLIDDVNIVSNQFISALFTSLRDVVTVVIFVRIALFVNTRLFFMCLIVLPVFSFFVIMLGKKLKKYAKRNQRQSSTMFSTVEEVLNSMPVVKAYSRENDEMDKFKHINNKYFNVWRRSEVYSALNTPISEMNSVITGVVVIILGSIEIFEPGSTFTFGNFLIFLLAIFNMLHPTKNLTKAYTQIKRATASLDRLNEVINKTPEIENPRNPINKKEFEDKIEFNNLNFSYNGEKVVLNDINLVVNKGEKIGLVGKSGSGKTTIVNLLNRMYDPTEGEILIDGVSVDKFDLTDLRSLFGVVTQDSILFSDTIRNNISYGTHKEVTDDEVIEACRIANATEFVEQFPNKYDEFLQTKGKNLSGGQRQRLCIARAIVGNPPILIFDEATSALDTDSERKVQAAIEKATENRTVFMIAHRLSTILSCDKIVVMDEGKIVGIGPHDELLKTCPRYEELYKIQFEH